MSEDDRPPAILPPGLGAMGLGGGERDASQASNHRLQTRPWWVSGMRWSVVGGLLFMLALALALPALGRAQEQQARDERPPHPENPPRPGLELGA